MTARIDYSPEECAAMRRQRARQGWAPLCRCARHAEFARTPDVGRG